MCPDLRSTSCAVVQEGVCVYLPYFVGKQHCLFSFQRCCNAASIRRLRYWYSRVTTYLIYIYIYIYIYQFAYTNVRFISCDGHQLYDVKERGVDLEVEGLRYIEMHRGAHTYILSLSPSRGGDLEL